MTTKDSLLSATRALGSVKSFIQKNHTICFNNQKLQRFDKEIEHLLRTKEIDEGKIELNDDTILISGRFRISGGGSFTATFVPNGFTWKDDHHAIYFKLEKRNFLLDDRFKNVMATCIVRLCDFLFGQNFITERMGKTDKEGNIEVDFDGHNPFVSAIAESIDLLDLSLEGSELSVTFAPVPQNALKHAKPLMTWWKDVNKNQLNESN